jgi:hypothetical protein
VVSQVRGNDWLMYLLAIKSFYPNLPGGEVVIMDDGTLTKRHRAAFRHHLGAPKFVMVDDVATSPCPRGGTWERLLYILDLSRDSYVVQIDSDMLATGPLPEIAAAIAENRAFTLGTAPRQIIDSVKSAAAFAESHASGHMQIDAERALPSLPPGLGRLYVRGSSGFAGFARGGARREDAVAFSVAMQERIGARWNEWGSEQVTSNYLVANSPSAMVLPWPKYACHFDEVDPQGVWMMHFAGSWRWSRNNYVRLGRQVIRELNEPPRQGAVRLPA